MEHKFLACFVYKQLESARSHEDLSIGFAPQILQRAPQFNTKRIKHGSLV